ncbi:MAG: glycolate oxidase subunit GlcE [Alphaproteobacteria bacterium]
MTDTLKPDSAEQVREVVAWAAAEGAALEIAGSGSKRGIGRPRGRGNEAPAHVLSLAGLSGITLYEPEELVLSARAGTPLAEIAAALAGAGQMLAFEPPDLPRLWDAGAAAGQGTAGGLVGCGIAGPRRVKAGAVRDHLLGAHGVSGRGEAFKTGGRVVKNVTGYDLSKLVTGAWGTLAALTEVTFKVLPAPEATVTLLLAAEDAARGVAVLTAGLGSSHDVSGAAYLPAPVARRSRVAAVAGAGRGLAALRLEGFAASVAARVAALTTALAPRGEVVALDDGASRALWDEIRDAAYFAGGAAPLWRVSVAPQAGAGVADAVTRAAGGEALLDWGGGLVWLALPDAPDAHATTVRGAVAAAGGGHATLLRAADAVRAAVPVFEPQPAGLAALSRRVKAQFDPQGILNPGRMAEGV